MSEILNLLNKVQTETASQEKDRRGDRHGTKHSFPGGMVSPSDHFGMRENPFADAINPEYYYKTASQQDAARRMFTSAAEGIALGLVTGPAGTGKTMVTQILMQSLDPARYKAVFLMVTPGMGKSVMLQEMLRELGVGDAPPRTRDLLNLLHGAVMELHASGRRPVVLADEAHFLSAGALHTLRTMSNLETPGRKLCTVLLFAERSFLRRLRHPSYRSLSSRIYHRVNIDPMSKEETVHYVGYRMMVAGARLEIFESAALEAIYSLSGGVCREVSRLCYLALMEGASRGTGTITEEIVKSL